MLLLDDVDEHWAQGKLLDQFQTNFVLRLLQHSSAHLEFLILPVNITLSFLQSYELSPLPLKDCVTLAVMMAPDSKPAECVNW